MGQLASKEKDDSVKIALILEKTLDDHLAEHTVTSAFTTSNHHLIQHPQAYGFETGDRLIEDVEYVTEAHYSMSSSYSTMASSTALVPKAKRKQEHWKKVTFSEIVDEEDKKRVEIVDIPGLKLLPAIRLYSHITHIKM